MYDHHHNPPIHNTLISNKLNAKGGRARRLHDLKNLHDTASTIPRNRHRVHHHHVMDSPNADRSHLKNTPHRSTLSRHYNNTPEKRYQNGRDLRSAAAKSLQRNGPRYDNSYRFNHGQSTSPGRSYEGDYLRANESPGVTPIMNTDLPGKSIIA